jgi:hypothetical protein
VSFILKAVLILFIFAFVVYVLKALARVKHDLRRAKQEARGSRGQEGRQTHLADHARSTAMLRCAACGAFVAAREAVTLSAGGRSQAFCSHACVQARAKSA